MATRKVDLVNRSGAARLIDLTRILRAAWDEAGEKADAFAHELGVSPQFLSMLLNGEKPCSLQRLAQFDPAVQRAFVKAWALALGLDVREGNAAAEAVADLIASAARAIAMIGDVKPRMLRAELATVEREREKTA